MPKYLIVLLSFLIIASPAFSYNDNEVTIDGSKDVQVRKNTLLFYERASDPGAPSANGLRLYAKDNAGVTTLYTKDSASNVVEIGAGGGGATAWDDVGDPDADTTIAMGGYETIFTSTLDEAAHYVVKIDNTDADLANETTLLGLEFTDDGDNDGVFIKALDNNGDLVWKLGINGRMTIGPGATDYILPTARGNANEVLMDNGAGAVAFTALADGNVPDALTINNATSVTTAALTVNGQADIEGYSSFGNGSALDASFTSIFDRDFTDSGNTNVSQVSVRGIITKDTFAPDNSVSAVEIRPEGIVIDAISPPVTASLVVTEPVITEQNLGTALIASTVYVKDAPTEGTENYALYVEAGAVDFDDSLTVGGTATFNSENADIDFIVKADSGNAVVYDAGSVAWYFDQAVVFNNAGADVDFHINTDDVADAFAVDGGTDKITLNGIPYSWPADDGDAGEQLQTDGAGVLSWEAAGVGGSGDAITVDGNAIDTTAAFANTGNVDFTFADGGVGGPDTVTANFTEADPLVDTEAEIEAITGAYFGASKVVTAGYIWVADGTDFESVPMTGDVSIAAGGATAVDDDSHNHTSSTISGLDISADTNLAAGRSLTMSGDSVEADAELYTETHCIYLEDPTAVDDLQSIWYAKNACTITSLWCESDQTVTAMLQVDDGTPADVDSVDLTCDSTPPEDTALDGDATMAAGDRLDLDVASVANTPTWVSICWTETKDD